MAKGKNKRKNKRRSPSRPARAEQQGRASRDKREPTGGGKQGDSPGEGQRSTPAKQPLTPKEQQALEQEIGNAVPDQAPSGSSAADFEEDKGLTPEQLRDLFHRVKALESEIEERERQLGEAEAKLEHNRSQLTRELKDLATEKRGLEVLRLNADSGFAKSNLAALERLGKDAEEAASSVHESGKKYFESIAESFNDLRSALTQFEQEYSELAEKEKELSRRESSLALEKSRIQGELQGRDEYVVSEVDRKTRKLRQEVKELESDVVELESTNAGLREQLRSRPVDDEVTSYRERIQSLASELQEARASIGVDPVMVQDLERQNRELRDSVRELRSDKNRLEQLVDSGDAAQADLVLAKDKISAMTSLVDGYKETIRQLKSDLDELVDRHESRVPFPWCSAVDVSPEWQSTQSLRAGNPRIGLKRLVADLRAVMASDPEERRFYEPEDIVDFLAGMASSRLLILQGLSGTGKTSLPVAIARALGFPVHMVEVAAGWREPQDLVGDYNPFERRFGETEFLKGIYEALTPRGVQTPSFMVLDEMNLSHPEQYFSDVLSAMEMSGEQRRLQLRIPADLGNVPQQVRDGAIPLPPNVWFIGTSNRDETTVALADKTFDRAHVMELPSRFKEVEVSEDVQSPAPLLFNMLEGLFDDAKRRHEGAGDSVVDLLHLLREPLNEKYDVAWGNRLYGMAKAYVPVSVAAGSGLAEAADRLVTFKVLRKIEGRYDLSRNELDDLRTELGDAWATAELPETPERSLELIEREMRRKDR